MKQIIAIHGGDAFPTYDAYIAALTSYKVELGDSDKRGWKANLYKDLDSGYEITLPRMPNANNAKYSEWKLWFEKYILLVEDGVVLIGHSLGGIFLAKFLAEEVFPKKIAGTFLVAAPYDEDGDRNIVEFVLPESLELLRKQGGRIHLYHSSDDPIVSFHELDKYHMALPEAIVRTFEDRGHFDQEELPELVNAIKDLSS